MANGGKLDGRIALVSGALRGIGRAVAECLAADGATAILTDLDAEDDAEPRAALAAIPGAFYVRLDATDEAGWQAARDQVEQRFGRLDILVNNVGADLTGKVQDLSLADWRRLMTLNIDTVFLGTKTFQPLLAQSGASTPYGSSIVNISSIMGLVGMGEVSAYNASKGAVRLFTKSNAIEFADAGVPIRVNSVHPGGIDTGMMDAIYARYVETGLFLDEQTARATVSAGHALGRMGAPDEIATGIVYLCSPAASFMTGSELVIDGGMTAR